MAEFFDKETLIVMAGVLIGTGSTVITTANGWSLPVSFLISGIVLAVCAVIIEMAKH